MNTKIALLSLLTSLLLPSAAICGVELRVQTGPSQILPRLPFTLRVEVVSAGSENVTLPRFMALEVVRASGARFVPLARYRPEGHVLEVASEDSPIIATANSTTDISIYASLEGPWYHDLQLADPGRYTLRLLMDDRLGDEGPAAILQLSGPALVSNEAVLVVEEPTGVDAHAARIATSKSFPWTLEAAREIWDKYPDSKYAAYAVAKTNDPATNAQRLRDAAAVVDQQEIREWHLLSAASDEIQLSLLHSRYGKLEAALAAARQADRTFRQLQRSSVNPQLRGFAKYWQAKVPSADLLQRYDKVIRGEPLDIVPFVECGLAVGEATEIVLGYDNGNADTVTIPKGAKNMLTPAVLDQVQPTEFIPGMHFFKLTTSEKHFTWHLDRSQLQVSVANLPVCEEDPEWEEEDSDWE